MAVLLKDELARVLMYGTQQLQFYIKSTYLLRIVLLTCRIIFLVSVVIISRQFSCKLGKFNEKPLMEKVKNF